MIRRTSFCALLLCGLSLLGCPDEEARPSSTNGDGGTDTAAGGGGAGGDGGADGEGGATTEPGAPFFLSFGTNVKRITVDESVIFTAVLSDPDGIDDLIGGSLESPDGAISYGAFATTGQEGAYSLSVSWDAIAQASPFDFVGEGKRTFSAVFFDAAGKRATRDVTVALHCDDAGGGACDGKCLEIMTDIENCGGCGNVCISGPSASRCAEGVCVFSPEPTPGDTCAETCAALSEGGHQFQCNESCSYFGSLHDVVGDEAGTATYQCDDVNLCGCGTACTNFSFFTPPTCDSVIPASVIDGGYKFAFATGGCCCEVSSW